MDDAKVPNVMGLKGKRVAVVSNSTTIEVSKGALNKVLVDAEVVPVASAPDGMAMLDDGKVGAFSSDQVVLIGSSHLLWRGRAAMWIFSSPQAGHSHNSTEAARS